MKKVLNIKWVVSILTLAFIIGCGGTKKTEKTGVSTYTVSVTASGFTLNFSGTVVLQLNGGNDLTVTVDETHTFAASLADGATYDVTVKSKPLLQNCAITDGSGTVSGANVTDVQLNCTDKSWSRPADLSDNISPDGEGAYDPKVAMDDDGNAIVAWRQRDGINMQIFISEYRSGSWTHPSSLSDNISPDGQSADYHRLAMDNNGDAVIVWHQSNGTNNMIYLSEYRSGSWTHPSNLATDNISPFVAGNNAGNPEVAMDNNGNAVIIWDGKDGANHQIFKSEYRSAAWHHPSGLIDNISPDGKNAFGADVAMDNNENAVITWYQYDSGDVPQIFKSEYRGGLWVNPTGLSDNISPNSNAYGPRVAMDDSGNAIIAWHQRDGAAVIQIFKSEYRGGIWAHPSDLSDNISPDGQDAIDTQVAMDNDGNAIIVWEQNNGTYTGQIFKSEYRGGTWTHPTDLLDHMSPAGSHASFCTNNAPVAMDNNGNIIIAWGQNDDSNYQIFKSEYHLGSWSYPSGLADNISVDGQNAENADVAMDNNGNAMIVWQQSDGANSQIFMSEFR